MPVKTNTSERVVELARTGLPTREIARILDVSTPTVSYHKKRHATSTGETFPNGIVVTKEYSWKEFQDRIDAGESCGYLRSVFGISKSSITNAIRRGDVVLKTAPPGTLPLVAYVAEWDGKHCHSSFRRIVKRRMVAEGLCDLSCSICGLTEWLGQPAPLELDHIDGDPTNNKLDNFRILCLHCHTQTETFGWRNKKARQKLGK